MCTLCFVNRLVQSFMNQLIVLADIKLTGVDSGLISDLALV